jgi:hypothetical protein
MGYDQLVHIRVRAAEFFEHQALLLRHFHAQVPVDRIL